MAPPLLLCPGYTLVQVHVFAPGFRRKAGLIGSGAFVFSAIAEFIAVAFAAYGTGKVYCREEPPF
jgi:hypothetical protein